MSPALVPPTDTVSAPAMTRKQRRAARAIARSAKHKDAQKRLARLEERQRFAPPVVDRDVKPENMQELSPLEQMAEQIRARKR